MSRFLFVSHVAPFPETAGNEVRIARMMRWLRGQGHELALLLRAPKIAPETEARLRRELDALFLLDRVYVTEWPRFTLGCIVDEDTEPAPAHPRRLAAEFAPSGLRAATYEVCQRWAPDVVLAEYAMAAPCLSVVPPTTLKLVDTHDVFSRREGADDRLRLSGDEEGRFLRESDAVIAIQPREAELIAALVPELEVITVGVDFPVSPATDNDEPVETPGRVLLVGSDNDANIEGALAFYEHAWPRIRDACPAAVLRIVGRLGERLAIAGERVEIAGWQRDLANEWQNAAVVINPTLLATGLKIKSIEALAHGKPLVATEPAVEGITFAGAPPFVACRDWVEFAAETAALVDDGARRRELGQRARAWASVNLAAQTVYRPLAELLERRLAS